MVLKGQYIQIDRASYNNSFKKYFTLGGFCGPERLVWARKASYNSSFQEMFYFGRVLWS